MKPKQSPPNPSRPGIIRQATIILATAMVSTSANAEPEKVWPPSFEMQMGDGKPGDAYVTGDLFVIGNTRTDSPSEGFNYKPGAAMVTRGMGAGGSRAAVTEYAEKPHGEWNLAE